MGNPDGTILISSLGLSWCWRLWRNSHAVRHLSHALWDPRSDSWSLTRHRLQRVKHVKPNYMALSRDCFLEITHRLELPLSYLHLRKYANGCGNFSRYTSYDDNDILRHLSRSLLSSVFLMSLTDFQNSSYVYHTLRPTKQNQYGPLHHRGVPTPAYRQHFLMACLMPTLRISQSIWRQLRVLTAIQHIYY